MDWLAIAHERSLENTAQIRNNRLREPCTMLFAKSYDLPTSILETSFPPKRLLTVLMIVENTYSEDNGGKSE